MGIYDFTVKATGGADTPLSAYSGKVLLIVNTATKCGLTPQYEQLEALYRKYTDRGLEILDFPCNQFLEQAPGTDEEIDGFCKLTYHTSFPRFSKIDVNGESAHPLYVWLKSQAAETEDAGAEEFKGKIKGLTAFDGREDIKWNFTKFLVDRNGAVAGRFFPTFTPEALGAEIEKLL